MFLMSNSYMMLSDFDTEPYSKADFEVTQCLKSMAVVTGIYGLLLGERGQSKWGVSCSMLAVEWLQDVSMV